ncbi:MAG: bifunctional oligoribonuclease/PAP phosphatase NrnA [Bdellovibrionales bacterium]
MKQLIQRIQKAKNIILSTHRQCDGDGLGAQLALYHALVKIGKEVRILNVDPTPKKYAFLKGFQEIQYFERAYDPIAKTDLVLVFDTNDARLLGELFHEFKKHSREVIFVDHHPVLEQGPTPTLGSYIDTNAASTGEIAYNIIKDLGIELDSNIAQNLYTSIVFDTQLFRFIRSSPNSHLISAELLQHKINAEEIHRSLFGNQTISKISFLAKALLQIEYYSDRKIAVLKVRDKDLIDHGLNTDETNDIIDMIMNIESIEVAVVFREDGVDDYKISFRSKGKYRVLQIAEDLGGGGHPFSAGAYKKGNFDQLKSKTLSLMLTHFKLVS